MKKFKSFSILESKCKRLNLFKYQKKPKFEIGQIVRNQINGRERYGKIIGFLHPEGLYTTSYERDTTGKISWSVLKFLPGRDLPGKRCTTGSRKSFTLDLTGRNLAKFYRWIKTEDYESQNKGNESILSVTPTSMVASFLLGV